MKQISGRGGLCPTSHADLEPILFQKAKSSTLSSVKGMDTMLAASHTAGTTLAATSPVTFTFAWRGFGWLPLLWL